MVWNVGRLDAALGVGKYSTAPHSVEFELRGHQRAISDLNWSPWVPELLATCSYDTYVLLWDLRNPDHHIMSFPGWTAGAQQVKFNKMNEHILASSHDTDVKIWDMRKGSTPLTHITAHFSKICGIDWSRTDESEILTCSQDQMIKIWNLEDVSTCLTSITTSAPCWRARFTPFGDGIVSMPQRKDTNLYLWNRTNPTTPVHKFEGHEQIPTEFVWRQRPDNVTDSWQLITWSKDNHLRFWPITSDIIKSASGIEFEDEMAAPAPIRISSRSNHLSADSSLYRFSTDSLSSLGPGSLNSDVDSTVGDDQLIEDELQRIGNIPGISVDRTLWSSRKCIITIETPKLPGVNLTSNSKYQLQVEVIYPKNYPDYAPYFELRKTFMISMISKRAMIRKLIQISNNYAIKKKPSVESCVRFLLGGTGTDAELPQSADSAENMDLLVNKGNSYDSQQLEADSQRVSVLKGDNSAIIDSELSSDDDASSDDGNNLATGKSFTKSFATVKDAGQNVPYPRLCGAVFSPAGTLCYFFSPFPHPSMTKFTSYSLTTRNQQPILQAQKFNTQPHNYPMYEQYRNFILSKCPRMFIRNNNMRSVPSIVDNLPLSGLGADSKSDRKIDFRLDDEDDEDEQPVISWPVKASSSNLQPQTVNTYDFLARLNAFNIKRPSTIAEPSPTNISSDIPQILKFRASPPTKEPEKHLRLRTTSTNPSEKRQDGNLDSLAIPYEEAEISEQYLNNFNLSEPRRLSAQINLNEGSSNIFNSPNESKYETGHGAIIYVMPLESLLPISSVIAKLYK